MAIAPCKYQAYLMKEVVPLANNAIRFPWVIVMAFLSGLAIISGGIRLFSIILLAVILPLLLYVSQRSFAFILKCMLAIVFFIPFQFFDTQNIFVFINRDFPNIFKFVNPLAIIGTVLAIKLFARTPIKKQPINTQISIVDILYAALLASAMISSLRAISILGSLNWIFYSIATGYFVYRAVLMLDPQEVKSILRFLVFIASLDALYGIWGYCVGHSLIYSGADRLTSLLGHYLLTGLVFATVFPFSLALYLESRKKIFFVTSSVIFLAVILTFSRGSWIALAVGFLAMFFFFRFKLKLKLVVTTIILAALIGGTPFLNHAITRRLNQSEAGRYSSLNVRRQALPIATSIIRDRPLFGVGPFNAGRYKEKYTIDVNLKGLSFENTYLGLLVDLGFVGIGILFLLGCFIVKQVVFTAWSHMQTDIYRGAALASLAILSINIGTFNFDSYRLLHFIVWFFVGLGINISVGEKKN